MTGSTVRAATIAIGSVRFCWVAPGGRNNPYPARTRFSVIPICYSIFGMTIRSVYPSHRLSRQRFDIGEGTGRHYDGRVSVTTPTFKPRCSLALADTFAFRPQSAILQPPSVSGWSRTFTPAAAKRQQKSIRIDLQEIITQSGESVSCGIFDLRKFLSSEHRL
jgi:hypothetical protein